MRIRYSDNEVDVDLRYNKSENAGKSVNKNNHTIVIVANGDFEHHVIEGIVNTLRGVQRDNPHFDDTRVKCKCGHEFYP